MFNDRGTSIKYLIYSYIIYGELLHMHFQLRNIGRQVFPRFTSIYQFAINEAHLRLTNKYCKLKRLLTKSKTAYLQ